MRWNFRNHHGIELARGNPSEYLRIGLPRLRQPDAVTSCHSPPFRLSPLPLA
jgi:hypothetical protein